MHLSIDLPVLAKELIRSMLQVRIISEDCQISKESVSSRVSKAPWKTNLKIILCTRSQVRHRSQRQIMPPPGVCQLKEGHQR